MLYYHQNGATLTLEFTTVGDVTEFQAGLADLLMQSADATDEQPISGVSLNVLALLMRAMLPTEQQTADVCRGLKKIGKLPEESPVPEAA
jgi:hypothetical protein